MLLKRSSANFVSMSLPGSARRTERNQKTVGEPKTPLIEVSGDTELAAVTEDALHAVAQKIVHAEIGLSRVGYRQTKSVFGVSPDFAHKELLPACNEFGLAHGALPERNLAEAVGALNPVPASLKRTRVFGTNAEGYPDGLPAHVEAEGVLAIVLQRFLPRSTDLEAWCGKEESHAAADVTLGIYAVNANARRRNVDRVVHIGARVYGKTSAEHRTVAGSGADGQNQRIRLQVSNPDGIQALIEDSEWREKAPRCNGQIWTRDVVHLCIIDVLVDRASVRPASRWPLKFSLKFRAGFDQPAIAEWNQQDGIDLGVDDIVSATDKAECAEVAGQDGNRFVTLLNLRGQFPRDREQEQQAGQTQSGPVPTRNRGFWELRRQWNPTP